MTTKDEDKDKADAAVKQVKAKRAKPDVEKGFVLFADTVTSIPYPMRIRGEVIRAIQSNDLKTVMWRVPARLASSFRKHSHVIQGRIIEVKD